MAEQHVLGQASEVGKPGRGRDAARPGGSVQPRWGAPPRAQGEAGPGTWGRGQLGDPEVQTRVPPNRSRWPCPGVRAARGAARPHSPPAPRAPLRSPRWLTPTSALRRGAQSHPDRRPARAVQTGRAPAGHRAVPPPPRRALPLPGGVERGGEQPPPASQAGALTGQVLSKQALGSRLGAQRALRPALGSPWVSPQAQGRLRLQTFLPTSSAALSPIPPAIFSITLPRCLFHGIHFSDGGP